MTRTILLVHGRSFKPDKKALKRYWMSALRHGVRRDLTPARQRRFEEARVEMVYYGHHSNEFLRSRGGTYDPAKDLLDRRLTLDRLKGYPASEFNRQAYNVLPGKTSLKEFLADLS